MKKLCIFLVALLLISALFGCQSAAPQEPIAVPTTEPLPPANLQAGFGRVDVTPNYSVPMAGYGNYADRMSQGVRDSLYVTCIAVSNGAGTVLMYTIDVINVNAGSLPREYREAATNATGIPADHIFMGGTHTHSRGGVCDTTAGRQWKKDLMAAIGKAGQEALADLAPCQMLQAKTNLENMNFTRHYEIADGTYYGSNFGDPTPGIVGHVGVPDDQMILLKFQREGDKKDILFVNWQAHPDHSGETGHYILSADFVGVFRQDVEEKLDVLVGYYGGASGNINPFSSLPEDMAEQNMEKYGLKLATLAIQATSLLEPVRGDAIATKVEKHTFTIDHSWDDRVEDAQLVVKVRDVLGKNSANAEGRKYGFSSVYHANAVVSRSKMGESESRDVCAFRIGDVGFIEAKCEMFSGSALYVKENSPFDTTVVICGNGTYIPTEDAYDIQAYEAVTSNFVRGSAESMNDHFLELLNAIK